MCNYGRFGEVDSLNPYWCDLVAAVRHDFIDNVTTPTERYAAIRTAQMCEPPEQRTFPAGDSSNALKTAEAIGGFPLLLIPAKDKRLGVRRVDNADDLGIIIDSTDPDSWNMRRCAEGETLSVDCLCSCRVEPEWGTNEIAPVVWGIHAFGGDGCVWSYPVSDNAMEQLAAGVLPELYSDRTGPVFFHADCVKLTKAVRGLGKKGDIVLNEWWQCTPHEFIIDLMNIEYDCDLRAIWASGELPEEPMEQKYCAGIACRSFDRSYRNPHEKIMRRLAGKLKLHGRTHAFDAGAFLDYHYIFSGADVAELKRSIKFITEDHREQPRPEPLPRKREEVPAVDAAPAEETDGFAARFAETLLLLESAVKQAAKGEAVMMASPAADDGPAQAAAATDKPAGKAASPKAKKGGAGRTVLKVLLIILIVIFVIELAGIGIKWLAPDSAAAEAIDNQLNKIIHLITGSEPDYQIPGIDYEV